MNSKDGNDLDFINVKGLNFHYEKGKDIIKNINLELYNREITIVTGSNGSGKSTLGKLLMGILKPISGEISIQGRNITQMSLGEMGGKIGYLFQNPEKQFFTHSVQEELSFVLKSKGLELEYINKKVDNLLQIFQLEHLRESFPLKLSQGEKQRLAIAGILVNDIEYLILDEPTTGLDVKRKYILIDKLKSLNKKGIGMTIISHDNEFIKLLADRRIKLDRGEIVEDSRE